VGDIAHPASEAALENAGGNLRAEKHLERTVNSHSVTPTIRVIFARWNICEKRQ
jgi:hypothetical protein